MNASSAHTQRLEQLVEAGAREAASALGRLLRVSVDVDAVSNRDVAWLASAHAARSVVIAFSATGGVPGTLVLVVDDAVAAWLAGRLTGQPAPAPEPGDDDDAVLGPTALGALAELGNIVASAFLNGTARVVGRTCLPSVPRVSHDVTREAIAAVLPAGVVPPGGAPVVTLRAQGHAFTLVFAG